MAGEAYSRAYATWHDKPILDTPIRAAFLQKVEDTLMRLLGADPTDAGVQVWDSALQRFKTIKLTATNIDPAAGIAKSQLAALGLVNADVAGGAAIARSKLDFGSGLVNSDVAAAAALAISKLAGYPADATKFLKGDGSWSAAVPGQELDYKQITAPSAGITATTEGTSVAVITGNSITYDGTRVKIEVWAPKVGTDGGNEIWGVLYRDSTVLGRWLWQDNGVTTGSFGNPGFFFDTPSAAAHVYTAKVFTSGGTATIYAGAGGAGALLPAFLRVTKA